jgi:TonB family protein
LWAVIGALVVVGVVAAVLWFGRGIIPHQQPAEPTPTAAEIAAQRQAQEDRLRTLTQEMVQTMMAEREEEIREELVARQQRIEELQRRLQQSERRAAQSASAAADEAETQEALKREIEQQEEAQRAQQDALETERQKSLEDAGETAIIAATGAAAGGQEPAAAEGVPDTAAKASTVVPTASPAPSPTTPPLITEKPSPAPAFGAFVDPDEADTLPVVVKSQALEWPRNAARSKGKGVVVVQLTVNAEGGVDDVEVLRADHEGWGIPEAALDAAAGYRFKPGTKDGVAITTHAYVTWRYDFTEQ